MSSDEDWVKAAMTDDSLVIDLLVNLHRTVHIPKPTLSLDWSVRQRRSSSVTPNLKKQQQQQHQTPRDSPTTPLSWSGATSLSGGVDGFEESSRPTSKRHNSTTRSKVAGTSETSPTKRSRKKKTLAELKEEESALLKERRHLKRELATLRVTLEEQRASNESLKRKKLDLQSKTTTAKTNTTIFHESVSTEEKIPAPSNSEPTNVVGKDFIPSLGATLQTNCSQVKKEADRKELFVLPDLNLPLQDDRGAEV